MATPKARRRALADELFAAVLADPTDEAALAVWADALLELEDPRGELVALGRQPASPKRDKLIATLVRKHARALLGKLGAIVMLAKHLEYERGLLVGCAIAIDQPSKVKPLIGHPEWRTVRSIYFRNYSGGSLDALTTKRPHPAVALLADPVFAALETVLGIGLCDVFAPLAARATPFPWREVFLVDYEGETSVPEAVRRAVQESRSFPALRRLGVERMPPEWLLASTWAGQLEEVSSDVNAPEVPLLLARVLRLTPNVQRVVVRPDRVFTNGFDRPEWVYTFEKRDGRFATVRVAARDKPGEDARRRRFLGALPPDIQRG